MTNDAHHSYPICKLYDPTKKVLVVDDVVDPTKKVLVDPAEKVVDPTNLKVELQHCWSCQVVGPSKKVVGRGRSRGRGRGRGRGIPWGWGCPGDPLEDPQWPSPMGDF